MTIKYSTNFVPMPTEAKAKTSFTTNQKLNHETSTDMMCCSGEFNTNVNNNSEENSTFKRLFWGSKMSSDFDLCRANELASDNSTSSISMSIPSSASSLGGSISRKDSRKSLKIDKASLNGNGAVSTEKGQRRKLLQMISHYEQQNMLLEQELAKEKRRRKEELSCVVKSLLCFEAKLKNDMKNVSKRLLEKDIEICRLFTQNRALKNKLTQLRMSQTTITATTQAISDTHNKDEKTEENKDFKKTESIIEYYKDGLALDELQCFSCRKKLYDIDFLENGSSILFGSPAASSKDGSRKHEENCTEQGSSSDETASSSFCGARRTVRYTSKRTSGTFQDYMQARSMNIDDPALDNNSDGNASTLSKDASKNNHEKLNCKTREVIKRHPSNNEQDNENLSLSSQIILAQLHNKDSKEKEKREASEDIAGPMEEEGPSRPNPLITQTKSVDFSEASPKQVYETSTDDWYASASDQEEITVSAKTTKSYGQDAVNPVLECVNQILLQQSMEETHPTDGHRSMKKPSHGEPDKSLHTKASSLVHRSNGSLIRQSSISLNGAAKGLSSTNEIPANGRNGTLNRKKVHFSTSNSMVHVPRNREENHDGLLVSPILSRLQSPTYNQPIYTYDSNTRTSPNIANGTETLNYESIYSNEYEPIGSENNSSNLYVDMEAANKNTNPNESKIFKAPPALPPKPANLLKFKKSLQQLDESPDEHLPQNPAAPASTSGTSEPDYCSISEVNVAITSVQIVADVHKAPESVASLENPPSELELDQLKLGSSLDLDEDLCGASQKTDEIEEIFVDIPKLPNVAAIIAPKEKVSSIEQHRAEQLQTHCSSTNEYMLMSPKMNIATTAPTAYPTLKNAFNINSKQTTPINLANIKANDSNIHLKSDKTYNKLFDISMKNKTENSLNDSQVRRKPAPNVLTEINRKSKPISPTSNGKATGSSSIFASNSLDIKPNSQPAIKTFEEPHNSLPLQAEFDWYNLDAEYGRTHTNMNVQMKLSESLNPKTAMLEEISEGHESIVTDADEYNLDEEFSLASETADKNHHHIMGQTTDANSVQQKTSATTNDAVYFSVLKPEGSPIVLPPQSNQKSIHNIKKNLANFEKFIEGSGLSTKPLPSKRKIYFAGPFV